MNTSLLTNSVFPIAAIDKGAEYLAIPVNTGFLLTVPPGACACVIQIVKGGFIYRIDGSPVNGVTTSENFLQNMGFVYLTSRKAMINFKASTQLAIANLNVQYFSAQP